MTEGNAKVYFIMPNSYLSILRVPMSTNLQQLALMLGSTLNNQVKFIFNGELLDISKPFSFEDVKQSDCIVAVKCTNSVYGEYAYKKYIKDEYSWNSLQKKIEKSFSRNKTLESLRLKDLHFIQKEKKGKHCSIHEMKRLINIEKNSMPICKNVNSCDTVIEYESPDIPSCGKLPYKWKREDFNNTPSLFQEYNDEVVQTFFIKNI